MREFAIRSSRSRDEKRRSHERSKEEDLKEKQKHYLTRAKDRRRRTKNGKKSEANS